MMQFGFAYMQKEGDTEPDPSSWLRDETGGSVYLRLSTRPLQQPTRALTPELKRSIIDGGYWMREPGPNARSSSPITGALAPEAIEAIGLMAGDRRDIAFWP